MGVANILKVMSRDAAVLEGSMALYVNLMKSSNSLSEARREMLAAVVSNINDCYY
jgi:alkylhydroperoxidase family enzyme